MIESSREHATRGALPSDGTPAPDGRPDTEQPRWRRDFPIDVAEDEYVARRDLVKFIVLTSAALAAGQFWIVAQSQLTTVPPAWPRRQYRQFQIRTSAPARTKWLQLLSG